MKQNQKKGAPTAPDHHERLKKLRRKMEASGVDAFITFDLRNVRYLTGYSGTNGAVLVTPRGAQFFTDFRYASQVKEEVRSMKAKICARPLPEEVAEEIGRSGAKKAGFEDLTLSVRQMAQLKRLPKVKWVPCAIVDELRVIKDPYELALLKRNFKLLERVFASVGEVLASGKRENEVAGELEHRLRLSGGEKPAFDFIIASGPRSALPHGVAGERRIGEDEVVIIDWGWVLDGYHSDNTRTVFLGKPKPKLKEVYEVVLEANLRAIARTAPGVPLKDIDAAAREYIAKKGYGEYFGHGTGHGVGLAIHEAPSVNARSRDTAREGMVFSIEPGIYLPGLGGVRIEDVVAVIAEGCEVLSRNIPK